MSQLGLYKGVDKFGEHLELVSHFFVAFILVEAPVDRDDG